MVKNLKTGKIDTEKQYSIVKDATKSIAKGGATGVGIAGAINTAFPALVPTFAGMLTGASELSLIEKIGIGLGLASSPAVQISGLGILAIGAGIGALAGGTVALVRGVKHHLANENVKTR